MKSNQQMKAERFRKVATRRVQKVIDSLDSLGKCASKNNYHYTRNDVEKMMKILKEKVRSVNTLYLHQADDQSEPFKF